MSSLSDKHSPAMYMLDEAASAVRVCVRTCQTSRALFWASQLLLSGETEYVVRKLLPLMASEDIGFGWGTAMAECLAIVQSWRAKECVHRVALTLVARMTLCFKSRMVVSAAGVAERTAPLSDDNAPALLDRMRAAIAGGQERRGLELAHSAFVAMQLAVGADRKDLWNKAFRVLRSLPHSSTQHENLTKTLCAARKQGMGSSRAMWFHAVLLHFYSDVVNWDVEPLSASVLHSVKQTLRDMKQTPNRRAHEVTVDLLDATTARGQGRSTLHHMAEMESWTDDEVSKSHGLGLATVAALTSIPALRHWPMRPETKVFDPYFSEFAKGVEVPESSLSLDGIWTQPVETKEEAKPTLKRKAATEAAGPEPASKRQRLDGDREYMAMSKSARDSVARLPLFGATRKGSPPMRVHLDGALWQGPFRLADDNERHRLKHVVERLRSLKQWRIDVVSIEQLWRCDGDVWIQYQPFVKAEALDMKAAGLISVFDLDSTVWIDHAKLFVSTLTAMSALAILGCRAGNLIVSKDDDTRVVVVGVDQNGDLGSVNAPRRGYAWHELLHVDKYHVTAMEKAAQQHWRAVQDGMDTKLGHHGDLSFLLPPPPQTEIQLSFAQDEWEL